MIFALPVPDLQDLREGNAGLEGVWHFDSGRPGRHVLISALVHGNELCGAWALKGLLEAGLRPLTGKLSLIFANLAGFDRFDVSRHDASRFVEEDLNRVWSADRLASDATLERRRAASLLPWVVSADWLLDLHSMHERAAPLLLTGLQQRNVQLARELGASARVVVDAGHSDGVRMRDHAHFGVADELADEKARASRSLLIECGFHGDLSSRDVARDMVVRFLLASGIVDEALCARLLPGWKRADTPFAAPLHVAGAVVARSKAFRFTEDFKGLECIARAGTVIGDNDGEPVRTPFDQCVLVMPSVRQANKGVTVVRFARQEA